MVPTAGNSGSGEKAWSGVTLESRYTLLGGSVANKKQYVHTYLFLAVLQWSPVTLKLVHLNVIVPHA